MTGRTVFDESGSGQQMLFVTLESEHPTYEWLNRVICVGDGRIDLETIESRIEVFVCEPGED